MFERRTATVWMSYNSVEVETRQENIRVAFDASCEKIIFKDDAHQRCFTYFHSHCMYWIKFMFFPLKAYRLKNTMKLHQIVRCFSRSTNAIFTNGFHWQLFVRVCNFDLITSLIIFVEWFGGWKDVNKTMMDQLMVCYELGGIVRMLNILELFTELLFIRCSFWLVLTDFLSNICTARF